MRSRTIKEKWERRKDRQEMRENKRMPTEEMRRWKRGGINTRRKMMEGERCEGGRDGRNGRRGWIGSRRRRRGYNDNAGEEEEEEGEVE